MASAGTAIASPGISIPQVRLPKLRWPDWAPRFRTVLFVSLAISPCFLCDTIGYWVQRCFYTPEQMANRASPETLMSQIRIFDVACPSPDAMQADTNYWASSAAQQGWPSYPQAGEGCFNPDRNLRGVVGLKVFSVACPQALLSALDQRRWVAYAADHHWGPYPQAGAGCVDP